MPPGLAVVLRLVRVEQDPNPQVARLDFRVVAVLQQRSLPHWGAGDACPRLLIDLVLDRV
jgi:hypothetical protein